MDRRIEKKFPFAPGILILSAIFLFPLLLFTQQTHNYGYALHDPWNVRIYKLKNGLKVFLIPDTQQTVISGIIAVNAGSAQDPEDATGLAHYLEHLLFKGTKNLGTINYEKEKKYLDKIKDLFEQHRRTDDLLERKKIYRHIDSLSYLASRFAILNEYDKIMNTIGARDYNASTSEDRTLYYTIFPYNQLERWLMLESERFSQPVFRVFHTELEIVYEEKNISMSSDNEKIWYAILKGLFTPWPYSRKTTIGEIEHLKKPSLVEIEKYFKKYYVAGNMALILSGNFHCDSVIRRIEKHFSGLPSGEVHEEKLPPLDSIPSPFHKIILNGKDRESLILGWRCPGISSRDYWKIVVLSEILHNNYSGFLDIAIEKKGWASGLNCEYHNLRYGSFIGISANPEGTEADSLRIKIISALRDFCSGPLSRSSLKSAITNIKKNFYKNYELPAQKSMYLAHLFSLNVSWQYFLDGFRMLDSLREQDILDIAKKIFNQPYIFIHKTNAPDSLPVIEKPFITPVYSGNKSPSTLFKKILSIPVQSISPLFYEKGKDYFISPLFSGIPFWSVPATNKNLFNLSFIYPGSVFGDSLYYWLTQVLPLVSSSSSTSVQWNSWLYENAISISTDYSCDFFSVEFECLNEKKDSLLKFLRFFLRDAELSSDELSIVQQKYRSWYQDNSLDNLSYFLDRYIYWKNGIYKGKDISPEQLKQLNPEWIKKHVLSHLQTPSRIYFSGLLKDTSFLIQHLSALCTSVPPPPSPLKFPAIQRDTAFVLVASNPQSMINLYFSEHRGPWKKYAPTIKFLNQKLHLYVYQKIREEKALAYSTDYRIIPVLQEHSVRYMGYLFAGTQSDKTCDALSSLHHMLKKFIFSEQEFTAEKKIMLESENAFRVNNLARCQHIYKLQQTGFTPLSFYKHLKNLNYQEMLLLYQQVFRQSPRIYGIITPDLKLLKDCIPPQIIRVVTPADIR